MKTAKKLLLLFMLLSLTGCGQSAADTAAALQTGSLEAVVTETGTVVFDDSYNVSPLVAAKVLTAEFEEGDSVTKGQTLYMLDSVDLENQIEQTRIALEKANEAHRQSQSAVRDLTLYSHVSGLVTAVYAHEGDYVTPGTPIAYVEESSILKLTIPFSVPEGTALYAGMGAQVILAVDGSVVAGSVSKVYDSPQAYDGGKRGVKVELLLQNPGALKKGDIAFAKIGEYSSITSAALENKEEQTIVAAQQGEIMRLSVREGDRVADGSAVLTLKNDAVTNSVATAALNVKDIRQSLSQLEAKLSDYIIESPIDGIAVTKYAREGDIVSPGVPLAVVADREKLYVETEIDEIYIRDIAKGQRVKMAVQSEGEFEYSGVVDRVNDSGVERNGVTYYTVRIAPDDARGLLAGMNMDLRIITGAKENAKYLPRSAVSGGRVTVIEKGKRVMKEVTTGIKTDEYIEILDGIGEDEMVVTEN